MPAGQLQSGDLLVSDDGQVVPVGELYDTGERERVYNLRVADHHTYFVGAREWGSAFVAHNTYQGSLFPEGSSSLGELGTRTNNLHSLLDSIAAEQRTTAIVRALRPDGSIADLVAASSFRSLSKVQKVYHGWGIAVPGGTCSGMLSKPP